MLHTLLIAVNELHKTKKQENLQVQNRVEQNQDLAAKRKMKTPQELQSIKAVSIVSYLQSIGHEPVKMSSGQFVYFSPFRVECSPSFFVNPTINVFKDFGTDEGGDVIRLVRVITGCSFLEAVATLEKFEPSSRPATFSFSGQNDPKKASPFRTGQFGIIYAQELRHGGLLNYAASRGISAKVATTYLQEVHYKNKGRSGLYALGFKNDAGGYELRSKYFKASTSPKTITTIEGQNPNTISVFEGFFDFLSACEFFGQLKPRNTTIVLNSLSNLNAALERLKTATRINAFFDNDPSGKAAIERLTDKHGLAVFDCSNHYEGHKDFNSFITVKFNH